MTFDRVRAIIVDHLGVTLEEVTPGANLVQDFGVDSLDAVDLILALEEEFHIDIADSAADASNTVGDLVTLVDRLVEIEMRKAERRAAR